MFDLSTVRVEALGPQHDRSGFECGVEPLDRYFALQVGQDARKGMAAPFVLVLPDDRVAGFYTLSATSVDIGELPIDVVRKLPRYPVVPATLLGRLAIDRRHKGEGLGRFFLVNALLRSMRSEVASFAVVVDAKDDGARTFYMRDGFIPFPASPMRLFLPMATIRKVFGVHSP